jgi:hypothetical protein
MEWITRSAIHPDHVPSTIPPSNCLRASVILRTISPSCVERGNERTLGLYILLRYVALRTFARLAGMTAMESVYGGRKTSLARRKKGTRGSGISVILLTETSIRPFFKEELSATLFFFDEFAKFEEALALFAVRERIECAILFDEF